MIISIGESRPKKWKIGAELIMAFEQIDYSHTFVSWKDENDLRWVAEARGSGVQIISNFEFKRENEVVNIYQYHADPENYQLAMEYVWKNSADKYSFKQIYGLAEMRVLNWIFGGDKQFSNRFANGDYSQICCEYSINTSLLARGGIAYYDFITVAQLNTENMGLRETRSYNMMNCDLMLDRSEIDRINGK